MNDFVVSLMLLGAVSSNASTQMPFWSTAGQFGTMPELSGGLALLRAGSSFDESRTLQWRWGASLGLRNDYWGVNPFVDELNAGLRWKKLRLDLGMIHPEQHFLASDPVLGPLTVTSGNVMMSGIPLWNCDIGGFFNLPHWKHRPLFHHCRDRQLHPVGRGEPRRPRAAALFP